MSTPPNGLRDENDIFGEAEPRVSVEIDRDEPSRDMPGDADGRPLAGGVDTTSADVEDPHVSNYGSGVEQPDHDAPEQIAGVTSPSRRGSSARFLTDVIVDMGLAPARARRQRDRVLAQRRHHARARAARERRDHLRRACPRAGRALRPRPPRPRRLPGRHGRRQPRRQQRRQALSGGAGRVRGQAHAAARDGRPLQRLGGRRRRDHDRL